MNIDFTEIFATPKELADFCMLDVHEQERIVADLAKQGNVKGASLFCELPKNQEKTNG